MLGCLFGRFSQAETEYRNRHSTFTVSLLILESIATRYVLAYIRLIV